VRASRSLSVAALAVVVLLSGCAHRVGTPDTAGSSADSGPATSAPTHYNGPWDGRMSLKLAAFGQEAAKGVQVTFNLDGTPARGTLDLSTPLGTRMASVQWHERMAVLRTSDGEQPFESLDELTRHVLGEALPIPALMAWLEGGPAADQAWQGQPEGNRQQFTQAGWQVDLRERDSGYIDAQRPASPSQRGVTLRVRIDR
jgi:outer membrane lipoprotein LolB